MPVTGPPGYPGTASATGDEVDAPQVDLDAYFARIGYAGSRAPTLETLRALQELHPACIIFEAIDVLLGRGIDLSPAAVHRKLIDERRGGYCFEQNGLFKRVLETLGFQVDGLLARVRWMRPVDDPPRPVTHMALRVTVDEQPWLVDVGFGSVVPTAPLRMDSSRPQPTGHEAFRLLPAGRSLHVEAFLGDQWMPLYELLPEPGYDADYELANWYTSTHPASQFTRTLTLGRTTPEARYSLLDDRLTVRRPDGEVERRNLDADGIAQALATNFGLTVASDWWPMIERAATKD